MYAINETGLNGNEYLGLNKGFNWFSANRTWVKGSSGGAGIIVKNNVKLLTDVKMYDVVKNIKVGRERTNMKWLISSIYRNCEGEPMGNSLVLLQAIRDLFPVWDASAEQALRAWILSMPSLLRARLDALSLDELQQLSGASPPPPATATVMTQTVRLFMPRSTARSLTSFDTTEPQNSMFTSTAATSSTASIQHREHHKDCKRGTNSRCL